ncbi:hypothetical protein NMY22_g20005 [Coprinellus aureogranulatus]|nr:hypothetical protein NMY22_g20005 [Coprinellus aureogranulatus]
MSRVKRRENEETERSRVVRRYGTKRKYQNGSSNDGAKSPLNNNAKPQKGGKKGGEGKPRHGKLTFPNPPASNHTRNRRVLLHDGRQTHQTRFL